MVDADARAWHPSQQALAALHKQFADSRTGFGRRQRRRRPSSGWRSPTRTSPTARDLLARPADRTRPGWSMPSAPPSRRCGQARTLLDAVDSAATDINRAIAGAARRRSPTSRTASTRGNSNCSSRTPRRPTASSAPRATSRCRAVDDAQSQRRHRSAGRLHPADQGRRRSGPAAGQRRPGAPRPPSGSAALDQALFAAQSRVQAVSDFIDTRRGSIGPEARTRLAEAVRQLEAAQDKRATNLNEAIAHANGAAIAGRPGAVVGQRRRPQGAARYTPQYGSGSPIWAR